MLDPAGSRILITGASSGIGAATARLLSKNGATVGIVGRRAELLAAVLDDCPGGRMWAVDLGDLAAAERLAEEAWNEWGPLDALINNAAIPKVRRATHLTPADVEQTMTVNFFSPVRMTLKVLPLMLARGRGMIINVSSLGGRLGIVHEAAYCSSKFALCGWSESLAIDLYGSGIDVRLIQPGPIDTDIWDRPGEEKAVFYDQPKVSPDVVAEGILGAMQSDRFEHYLPDMKEIVTGKDADIDSYINGIGGFVNS